MQHRQCVVLHGDTDWCRSSVVTLLNNIDSNNIIWLSDHPENGGLTIPQSKAQSQLGKEFDAVVFDAQQQLNPDSLGIIIGTVKAGGVLILLLAESESASLFQQRFNQISSQFEQRYESFCIAHQGDNLPSLISITVDNNLADLYHTDDQQQAVSAILKVVHGHRRRPLVLSADRGRGKSAALGIAAAQLLIEGKQKVLVTAPSLGIADTVFKHAADLLPDAQISAGLILLNGAEIRFVAPDILIESEQKADLLLVDEAAAIPAAMLELLLQQYSRIVFATTLHGYEGTGRGFAIRFQQILDNKTPDWHHFKMVMPIRWQQGDMLEKFSFKALLLDAEPVDEQLITDVSVEQCTFEQLDRSQLIDDEQSLKVLFGLMVLAHYRTRPSDLQMMLDRDEISVYALRYQGHIVASAWLVEEGSLDDELSAEIHGGTRRLKGHLLPQSLLAHAGITTAGSLRYQRIIRIAVHPEIQQQGIGTKLLQQLCEQAEKSSDIIGVSFAADQELLNFWRQSNFVITRLGIHKDDVSGSHAVMMLRSTSKRGVEMLEDANQRFQQQWLYYLATHFKHVEPELVLAISQTLSVQKLELSRWDKTDIEAFANGQRGFEFSEVSLTMLASNMIRKNEFLQLTTSQQYLVVMLLLQQRDWQQLAKQLGYSGKKQIIAACREIIRVLIVR